VFIYTTQLNVVITQKDLIAKRREEVYKLHWKGKSSREIAAELGCSFKLVCLDIKWLEKNANEEIKEQRKAIALEYKETVDIFRYLLRKALDQFEKAEKEGNEDRMERLYPIIESLNANLQTTRSAGYLVEKEVIEQSKEKAQKLEEGMKKVVEQTSGDTNQAIF
jgi:hypothetical protein